MKLLETMFKSSYDLVECDAFNEEQDSRDTKDLVNEVTSQYVNRACGHNIMFDVLKE